jgi:hypothetical protein
MDNHPARGTRAPAWLWAVFVAVLLAITPATAGAQIPYHASAGPAQSGGAVLLVHPGGWIYTGKLFADLMMRDWGGQFDDRYTTWSTTYTRGAQSSPTRSPPTTRCALRSVLTRRPARWARRPADISC